MPSRKHVVPAPQEQEDELSGVVGCPSEPGDGAGGIASNGLTFDVDGGALPVKGEMCALELHSRVGTIVPAVVQDDASTLTQCGWMLCHEAQLQNSHDDGHRDGSTHRTDIHVVELLTFNVAKAGELQAETLSKCRPRQAAATTYYLLPVAYYNHFVFFLFSYYNH